ncbi:MAG: bifunctional glutamate N-acetyltransferase/amino-acid acetyltransferase ArgJ [Elusimicrobiota bacterium]|jgi:glutamate N-acetyltransferase/amino-acid N-acetyltransferase|nr:bifunctional glutamate N-acetyltransferase/amino-acid acetyltransferase ArgJ [Elusimicrobiota bacterium]
MIPKGFKVGGVAAGISSKKGKLDLSLFISTVPAVSAAMFTSNVVKAAPVLFDIELSKNAGKISGIIANSGCANACTGNLGLKNVSKMVLSVEKTFKLAANSVFCASTGIIGQHIILSGLPKAIVYLKETVGSSKENEESAVLGIMTTDTAIKKASKTINIDGKDITIWGCVKGSGMICPDLKAFHATMLSFVLTDAAISKSSLQKVLSCAADMSFNCVTIDGDTSTNDTLIALANGQSGAKPLSGKNLETFAKAFNELCLQLAKGMAKDGEGATKFIEIEVKNAKSKENAKAIASSIALSPLFKTAMFGADANWGRILSAAGKAGVNFDPAKTDIHIAGFQTFHKGKPVKFSEQAIKKELLKNEIKICVDLRSGKAMSKYYTCDFSYDYVKINGDYRS